MKKWLLRRLSLSKTNYPSITIESFDVWSSFFMITQYQNRKQKPKKNSLSGMKQRINFEYIILYAFKILGVEELIDPSNISWTSYPTWRKCTQWFLCFWLYDSWPSRISFTRSLILKNDNPMTNLPSPDLNSDSGSLTELGGTKTDSPTPDFTNRSAFSALANHRIENIKRIDY